LFHARPDKFETDERTGATSDRRRHVAPWPQDPLR